MAIVAFDQIVRWEYRGSIYKRLFSIFGEGWAGVWGRGFAVDDFDFKPRSCKMRLNQSIINKNKRKKQTNIRGWTKIQEVYPKKYIQEGNSWLNQTVWFIIIVLLISIWSLKLYNSSIDDYEIQTCQFDFYNWQIYDDRVFTFI